MKKSLLSLILLLAVVLVFGGCSTSPTGDAKGGKGGGGSGGGSGGSDNLCKDGIDNDGDSLIDSNDPGCTGKKDKDETNADIACDDGVDNDGDGNIDMADDGCDSLTDNEEYTAPPAEPDSCADTDGGYAPYFAGNVSGYLNNTMYSNSDYCMDNTTLVENYCSGNYATSSEENCALNASGYCSNGQCMIN